MPDLIFDNPEGVEFAVEPESRTIRGLALPYGDTADNGNGKWAFVQGALTWARVKLLNAHDWNQVIGTAELEETPEGLMMNAKVANTRLGDEVLALAEMGAIDGLSVGLGADLKAVLKDGVQHVKAGTVREVSTTPIPAFTRAAITSVAASAAQNKENTMEENETVEVETPVSLSADDVRTIFAEELAARDEDLRPVVPAGRPEGAQFQIREESMYRFDGAIPGKHDFAKDVTSAVHGDADAHKRVMQFMGEHLLTPGGLAPKFAEPQIDTGNTSPLNPARYRPDMFLDEGPAQPTPLYEFFHKGGLSDVTPFFYSKLKTYAGLLGDHTEGVEPTGGTFETETGATVTPSPISGKIHITREVHDQGGSPQVSGLVWSKFQRVFRQMLETKTFGILSGGTYSDFVADPAAGADGNTLGAAIEGGVVDLQFTADGSRFRKMFGHVEAYKTLISAVDSNGRKLYPVLNPSNADGQASNLYGHVNVAGLRIDPTWSLGATGTGQISYLADPNAVHVWNSGLTKLEKLNEDVEGYDIGAWAYFAGIVYDATGVKTLTYDSTAA